MGGAAHRSRRPVTACVLLAALIAGVGTGCGSGYGGSEAPAPKGPGGNGDLLLGARWKIHWVVSGGTKTSGPPDAGAWITFDHDGTAEGSDGCAPFQARVTVTASTVSLPETQTTADHAGTCPEAHRFFEDRLRKALTGQLSVTAIYDGTMDLTNPRGEQVRITLLWPEGLYGRRWRLSQLIAGDSFLSPRDSDEVYFVFRKNGTVSGKLGCDDFAGRAAFRGEQVTLSEFRLTTDQSCDPETKRQQKWWGWGVGPPKDYQYSVTHDSVSIVHDADSLQRSGYELRSP
ncbi:META domain-containing protein [Streptomyces sp. NPDC006341]|uniref:META domain-containing protein n=1 Tax=Streptomyces sp. NPDC006341 TaxID=3156756 RepID=UPI0033B4A06A